MVGLVDLLLNCGEFIEVCVLFDRVCPFLVVASRYGVTICLLEERVLSIKTRLLRNIHYFKCYANQGQGSIYLQKVDFCNLFNTKPQSFYQVADVCE